MKILSRVTIATGGQVKQVLILARVVELNRSNLKDIGVDWTKIVFSGSSGSGQPTFAAGDQPFIIGQSHAGPFPLFGGPPIEQLDAIGARVNALLIEKRAHLLSQPSLVTASGTPANILIGGEIPIPVPQSGTGGSATKTIEYKPFGISLNVIPTVDENNEVTMLVKPEVSSLDRANGLVMNGFRVPAIRTRKAESTVHVRSGCSIAIGGLISQDDIKSERRSPLLRKIPILGNFFKSVSTDHESSELLIIVTPQVVETAGPQDVLRNLGADVPAMESRDPKSSIGPELSREEAVASKLTP